MRVTKSDLENFGLLESLPPVFKEYKEGEFFVFYYHTINEQSKLKVFATDVVRTLNISLYRKFGELANKKLISAGEDASIGYFAYDSFESRSGLFYLFLNTYCEKAAVQNFYAWCVENDVAGDYAISTSAMNDIYERGNFERVLAFFLMGKRIASVMSIYDLVDQHMRSVMGKSLYGGYIKKVVQLIPYEGGVLPERNGDMRYMMIGEKAYLTDGEKEKLEKAKALLRSLVSSVEIFKATGWYFNEHDGKWRHNLSDAGAYIMTEQLSDIDGKKVYNPKINPVRLETLENLFAHPEKLYSVNYMGKLSDVLYHPELFSRYPDLANMPLLYRDSPNTTNYTFYHSPNSMGGFMVIDGNGQMVNLVSTMLHESQHGVQEIEGFATGGNKLLATFVMSVGGENVRKIFYNIKMLEKALVNQCSEKWMFENLQGIVYRLVGNAKTASLKADLVSYTEDYDKFRNNIRSFALTASFYLTSYGQLASGELIEFFSDITNGEVYTLTECISEGLQQASQLGAKLLGEGYRPSDVNQILFNAYEDLMGEVESRSVEHQMMLSGAFQNYFFLYDWEKSPTQQIGVISDDYIEIDTQKIEGAVERIGDEYILHFKQTTSTEPFLHELAHIVEDILVEMGHDAVIQQAFLDTMTKHNRSEYFVDVFLGFIRENFGDENIQDDLAMNFDIKTNEEINELLKAVFGDITLNAEKFENGGDVIYWNGGSGQHPNEIRVWTASSYTGWPETYRYNKKEDKFMPVEVAIGKKLDYDSGDYSCNSGDYWQAKKRAIEQGLRPNIEFNTINITGSSEYEKDRSYGWISEPERKRLAKKFAEWEGLDKKDGGEKFADGGEVNQKEETIAQRFKLPEAKTKEAVKDNVLTVLSLCGSRSMGNILARDYLSEIPKELTQEYVKWRGVKSFDELAKDNAKLQDIARAGKGKERQLRREEANKLRSEDNLNKILAMAEEQGAEMDRKIKERFGEEA